MKSLLSIVLICLGYPFANTSKAKGRYRVVFNIDFSKQVMPSYIINFNDSTYESLFPNGNIVSGKIKRLKDLNVVYLTDKGAYRPESKIDSMLYNTCGGNIIEFEETDQDTMAFRTTCKTNLHITINEGKLIKLK